MRRTALQRTGWPRKPAEMTPGVDTPSCEKATSVTIGKVVAFRLPVPVQGMSAPRPKAVFFRSELYRKAVASLPCIVCGIQGWSQAAHGSGAGTEQSKGMGMKSCDTTCFPACADRPGIRGHHSMLDQGAMYDREERHALEQAWAQETQRNVVAMGKWPANFPPPPSPDGAPTPDPGSKTEYF